MTALEKYERESTEARMKTCPVCGKRFYPAPEHAYQTGYDSELERNTGTLVCTYSCMRKWEKDRDANKKERKQSGPKCPVLAINIKTGEETRYETINAAARALGVSPYRVKSVLNGIKQDVNGFTLKQLESPKRKPVMATNIDTGEKIKFESIGEASRELKVPWNSIYCVLNGTYKRTGRYTFEYCD